MKISDGEQCDQTFNSHRALLRSLATGSSKEKHPEEKVSNENFSKTLNSHRVLLRSLATSSTTAKHPKDRVNNVCQVKQNAQEYFDDKGGKHVSFDDSDEIISSHFHFNQDKTEFWLTRADRAISFRDRKKTLLKLQQKKDNADDLNESKYCVRGLEEYYCPNFPYTEKKRRRFLRTLVALQDEQVEKGGGIDHQKLKDYSLAYSQKSIAYANEMASKDYEDVYNRTSSTKKNWLNGKILGSSLFGLRTTVRSKMSAASA